MKIIFLNAWGDEMRDELVLYIEAQAADTDIFCFQEATDKVKRSCAGALAGYRELSDYKYISDDDNFPQAMYIKNDIEVVSSGTLFANDPGIGLALYAEIKVGESCMYVCNVHGRARPNEKLDNAERFRFSSKLIQFFDEIHAPIVIGGDFNLEAETDSIGMFEKNGYRDLIKEFGIKTTRNHFAWDKYPGHELYYSDYVFLNETIQLQYFAVRDNDVSDHLPLILQVEPQISQEKLRPEPVLSISE